MQYKLNAEIFCRIARNLLGIGGYTYRLHITQSHYHLWIADAVWFSVPEYQLESQAATLKLTADLIDFFKTIRLAQAKGDITVEIEDGEATLYFPAQEVHSQCELLESGPLPPTGEGVEENIFEILVDYLKNSHRLTHLWMYNGYVLGTNADNTTLYWRDVIRDATMFEIDNPRLIYNTLSKVKAVDNQLKISSFSNGNGSLNVNASLKLTSKEIVEISCGYLQDEIHLDKERITRYLTLIRTLQEQGREIQVTSEKVDRAYKVIAHKDLDEGDLFTFTETAKLLVSEFQRLFKECEYVKTVKIYRNKLLVTYSDERPSIVMTLHLKPKDYELDTPS